jgi:hypothetical protein
VRTPLEPGGGDTWCSGGDGLALVAAEGGCRGRGVV